MRALLAASLNLFAVATLAAQQTAGGRPGAPTSFADYDVIPLASGPNSIDLNADGKPDVVFQAFLDNGTPHSYHVITFYLADPRGAGEWHLVPLYDSTLYRESYQGAGGADCTIADLLVVRPKVDPRAPVELVLATREPRTSFVDSTPVTFVVYRFMTDSAPRDTGWPRYSFRAVRTIQSRGRYCDVFDAFEHELGLGHYAGRP